VEAEEKIQLKLYEKQQADMAKLADYVEVGLDESWLTRHSPYCRPSCLESSDTGTQFTS